MKPNQLPAIIFILMLVSNIKTAHSMEITPLMEQLDQQNNIVISEISDKQEKDESSKSVDKQKQDKHSESMDKQEQANAETQTYLIERVKEGNDSGIVTQEISFGDAGRLVTEDVGISVRLFLCYPGEGERSVLHI